MARWRLMAKHYLNVPGTEWERVEVSRETGKQARVRYPVNLFLDPDNAADHNHPGEVIVAYDKKGHHSDIVFVGPPTPDMEPVDDEAEKISGELRPLWASAHPIDSLPPQGDFSQSMLTKFQGELVEAMQKAGKSDNVSVKADEFNLLKKQVADLAKQNAQLLAEHKGK